MDKEMTGLLIAQVRKEKELTQENLAQALHVTTQAVSKWERGLSFPDVALLEPLAEYLELTVSELLAGERGAPPQEERVLDSLRVGLSQLGGKVKKWRGLFWTAFVLLLAMTIRLGYVCIRDNTELFPQNETIISPREATDGERLAAGLGQMQVEFFDLTIADGVEHYSLTLELWTHQGLTKTWEIVPENGIGGLPRHQTVALANDVTQLEQENGLSTWCYGAYLSCITYRYPCRDIPGLQNGYITSPLTEPAVVSPEHGVVLSCTSLDLNDQMEWRTPGWVGAIEGPVQELTEGQGMLLVRLRCR